MSVHEINHTAIEYLRFQSDLYGSIVGFNNS
jgi:hypothetical protein